MSHYIPEKLRLLVAARANFCCEYCRVHQDDMVFTFQVDHILSLKHGGQTELINLALACSACNQTKGSDLGTYLSYSHRLVRLFNPRRDKWHQHFEIDNGVILGKTRIGEATIKVLDLNQVDRIILRQALIEAGTYPN